MRLLFLGLALSAAVAGSTQAATRLWLKTVSQPGSDTVTDIVVDTAGAVLVCGSSVQASANGNVMFATKFDRNGNKIWEKFLPSATGYSTGQNMTVDNAGNAIVIGNTNVGATEQSRIVKLASSNGSVVYDVAGPISSSWSDVAVDSLGEATATGYVNTGGGKIMRTSHFLTNGTLTWSRDYSYPGLSGAPDQHGAYIRVDGNNDIYVCGVHNNFPTNSFNTLVKYSRTSTQLWMKHETIADFNYPRGLTLSQGKLTFPIEARTSSTKTLGIAKYDSNGTRLNLTTFSLNATKNYFTTGFDTDPDGLSFYGGTTYNSSNQLEAHFFGRTDNLTGASFSGDPEDPDLRTLVAGRGNGDCYAAYRRTGPTYPATIEAMHSPLYTSQTLWEDRIFGSTANGQIPTATVKKMAIDDRGDLYVCGDSSGAQGQDCFIAKYETGPMAVDDQGSTAVGQTYNSPLLGFLKNDAQISQAQLSFVQMPLHGVFSPSADGTFTYVPDPGFAGVDRILYKFTRTNGVTPRTSYGNINMSVYPTLTNAYCEPDTVQGGQSTILRATASTFVQTDLPLATLYLTNSMNIGDFKLIKDQNYGKIKVFTLPTTTTINTMINVYSGASVKSARLTITP